MKEGERLPQVAPTALPRKIRDCRRELFRRSQRVRVPNDEVTGSDQVFETQKRSELAPQARRRADAQATHFGDVRLPESDGMPPHAATLGCSTRPWNRDVDPRGCRTERQRNAPELGGRQMTEERVGRRVHGEREASGQDIGVELGRHPDAMERAREVAAVEATLAETRLPRLAHREWSLSQRRLELDAWSHAPTLPAPEPPFSGYPQPQPAIHRSSRGRSTFRRPGKVDLPRLDEKRDEKS